MASMRLFGVARNSCKTTLFGRRRKYKRCNHIRAYHVVVTLNLFYAVSVRSQRSLPSDMEGTFEVEGIVEENIILTINSIMSVMVSKDCLLLAELSSSIR